MILTDQQYQVTVGRVARLQGQVSYLRKTEKNPTNYRASISGFISEIDRMQLEIREYLSLHPLEVHADA